MNIGEWVFKRAFTYPNRPFLKETDREDREFTNREFNERVNRMAHALTELGVVRGERVAALLLNSSEFLEIFFACAKTGAVMVPMNFRLAVPELSYIIGDSRPNALVYTSDFADNVKRLKKEHKGISHFLRHSGDELPGDPLISDFASEFPAHEPEPEVEVVNSDPLVIMYTSGTTGNPKGVIISHENILFDAVHNILGFSINPTYRSLVTAPLFHIGALGASTTPVIYGGGSLVLKRFFNASEILKLIVREKVNYMFAVPVMFQMMCEAKEWEGTDFSHVHYFISGGAPMAVPVIRKYQEEKGVGFVQGYGMTEALRLSSLPLEDSIRKAGSVGKEEFHVIMRIVDEDANDVPEGEVGEVIIKGPNVFSGYWNKPEETGEALRGGWFFTGDMGRRDEEGFLYLVGRKQELIISSGENIYPIEIEKAIRKIPEVKESVAVGMPDPRRGEVVCVFVSLKEGETLTEDELVESLTGKIADFKLPKKVYFVDDFPRNPTGKILRRELTRLIGK